MSAAVACSGLGGAEKGYAFDTFWPERATRHTFRFFGTLMLVGLVLVALRWLG